MIRRRSLVLWGCLALSACGKKFEAGGAPESAGASSSGASSGGALGQAGAAGVSDNGGDAGQTEPGGGAPSGGAASGGAASGAGGLPGIGGLPSIGGGGDVDAGEVPPISTVGLALWLRADRGVTVTGGHVSEWLDQSGNQMDALQTAGNARPTLLPTGLNGLPTLDFDGGVQYLRLPDGFADFNKGLSGFVVSKATVTDGSCASTVELSNGSEVDDIELGYWKQGWQYEVFDHDFAGGMVDPKLPELYSVLHRATEEVVMRLNGNQANTASFPLPVTKVRQDNFIGHSLYAECKYYQGQISEVVLYNRIVTDKELLTIEGYLQQHWAL
ncbi:MAG TPA: hypothetical protein VGL19_20225 [Polyangiaceae bacterium]